MNDLRKARLIQQYEEAALGILMEEYAEAEGARLLQSFEAASRQGTVSRMPEELDTKYRKLIGRTLGKHKLSRALLRITKAAGRAVAAVALLFGLVSATILSVDAWRIPVLNFILDESGDHGSLEFENSGTQSRERFAQIIDRTPGFVPVGFVLVNQPSAQGAVLSMQFRDEKDGYIVLTVHRSTCKLVVDTENAEYTELEVAGHSAFLIQKEDIYIVWNDEAAQLVYAVYANGISADEFWELVYALAE